MAAAIDTLERLAAEQAAEARAPSKRMLVIVNPYATTVSDRLKNLVVYALLPTIIWRAFWRRTRMLGHRQVEGVEGPDRLRVRSADDRPVPLQVDGDYIGEVTEAEYGIVPRALAVMAGGRRT
jgi:diacylglycerol kinase family enzyme